MAKITKSYQIGIDVGGTNMRAVLFDGKKVLQDYSLATPNDSLKHFLIMLKALVEPLLENAKKQKKKVEQIGIGVPGLLEPECKKILSSPNLSILNKVNLVAEVEEIFSLPIIMDNDVNCFLLAEMTRGAGNGYENVYGITIGTGIGGAWWHRDEIYRGAHGGGGEPGMMFVDFSHSLKLEEAYHKLTQNNPANMAEEAYRGDVLAERSFAEVGEFLGKALANIANLLDPQLIIIGGGVIESGELFLSLAKKNMREHIDLPETGKTIKISKSKLGNLAGAIGAALLAKNSQNSNDK